MRPFNAQGKYARHTFFKDCKRLQLFSGIERMAPVGEENHMKKGVPKTLAGTGGFKLKHK